jgi:hypothetical protein
MTLMTVLAIVWAVLTTVLVLLFIYRSTLTMHEDNQIFLDDAEAMLEEEQIVLRTRMNRLTPILRTLMAMSGALILIMAGIFVYRGIQGL